MVFDMARLMNEFFYVHVVQGEDEASQHIQKVVTSLSIESQPSLLLWMIQVMDRQLLDTFGQVLPDRKWNCYSRLALHESPYE